MLYELSQIRYSVLFNSRRIGENEDTWWSDPSQDRDGFQSICFNQLPIVKKKSGDELVQFVPKFVIHISNCVVLIERSEARKSTL